MHREIETLKRAASATLPPNSDPFSPDMTQLKAILAKREADLKGKEEEFKRKEEDIRKQDDFLKRKEEELKRKEEDIGKKELELTMRTQEVSSQANLGSTPDVSADPTLQQHIEEISFLKKEVERLTALNNVRNEESMSLKKESELLRGELVRIENEARAVFSENEQLRREAKAGEALRGECERLRRDLKTVEAQLSERNAQLMAQVKSSDAVLGDVHVPPSSFSSLTCPQIVISLCSRSPTAYLPVSSHRCAFILPRPNFLALRISQYLILGFRSCQVR